ncbi:hypothetical protein HPB52_007093 [Rhipicephalus sanguineus]|uniref:Tc1-like transposase DDE domain-containing protein n=1 Tax=Rhipicephalus sanguineus TaxID=34632 RepID=A0A9D4QH86_RHISA|nr:hypothetical protein HPB52_007093 [Rhipicephalus sanguineus]
MKAYKSLDSHNYFTSGWVRNITAKKLPSERVVVLSQLVPIHLYSVKLVTQRPADRNRDDIKHSRKVYAQWLQSDGPRLCRFYLDETNYNIWCSRNFGRTAKGQPAVHATTTTKGAKLNIMACMSANGVIHWTAVDRVHWAVFNDFLSDVSARLESEEPNTVDVFIFDGAPAHTRAEQAAMANSMHSIKRLPAYSPFFNPIEEVLSKFKSHVKAYLSERPDLVLATPQGMTKKEHRRSLRLDAARQSMQQIQRVHYAAFDRHNFSFVPAALRDDDLFLLRGNIRSLTSGNVNLVLRVQDNSSEQ